MGATTKKIKPKQPDMGSLAALRRDGDGGAGLNFFVTATIACQSPIDKNGRACVNSDKFERPLVAFQFHFDLFTELARTEFDRRGWKLKFGNVRCPECRRKRC